MKYENFFLAFSFLVGSFIGLMYFAESDFVKTGFPRLVLTIGGYTSNQFYGVLFMIVSLPIGVYFLGLVAQEMLRDTSTTKALECLALASLFTYLTSAVAMNPHMHSLMSCGVVFCAFYGPNSKKHDSPNGYFQLFYFVLFCNFLTFALLFWIGFIKRMDLIATLWRRFTLTSNQQVDNDDDKLLLLNVPLFGNGPVKAVNFLENKLKFFVSFRMVFSFLVVFFVLTFGFFSSTLLPNSWLNWTAHKIRVNAIEIVDHESAFRDFKFGFVSRPELPDAVFKTFQVKLGELVWAKIYPDVYLFYSYLFCLLGGCMALRTYKTKQVWFAFFTFIVFLLCFIHSWWYHNWHGYYGGVSTFIIPKPSFFEQLARTLGQVSNVLLGLLTLPVGKHSPLLYLMRLSWEDCVWIHRGLGNCFLLVTFLHVFSWWKVWSDQNVFSHDWLSGVLKSAPTYFPLNAHAKPGHCTNSLTCLDPEYQVPASDNFTIPLMNWILVFVIIPVFCVLTLYQVRRANYKLFLIAHHVFGFVLVFGVIFHAAASFVFLLPGLIFIYLERIQRIVDTKSAVIVSIAATGDENYTRFQLGGLQQFQPGQFFLLCFPQIDKTEYHPFSVFEAIIVDGNSKTTSLGGDTHTGTFHVKHMGRFTKSIPIRCKLGDVVYLQGPFGVGMELLPRHGAYVFLAGGIGITAMMSMLSNEVKMKLNEKAIPILFIWVARDGKLFEAFHEELKDLKRFNNVTLCLYDTSNDNSMVENGLPSNLVVEVKRQPRPNLKTILLQNEFNHNKKQVALHACGPESFMQSCKSVSSELNYEYFEQSFVL